MQYWIIPFLILLAQLSQCSMPANTPTNDESQTAQHPSPQPDLRRNAIRAAWGSEEWTLVYSLRPEDDKDLLTSILDSIVSASPYDKRLSVAALEDLDRTDLGSRSLILVGTQLPGEVWENLSAKGPQDFRGQDLTSGPYTLRSYFLQNPWTPEDTSMAMHLIYAADVQQLRDELTATYTDNGGRSLLRGRYGYQVDEQGKARLKGFLGDETWRPDPDRELVFQEAGVPVMQNAELAIYAPDGAPGPERLAAISGEVTSRLKHLESWFPPARRPALSLYVYPSLERITLRFQEMSEVIFHQAGAELHLDLSPENGTHFGADLDYALLRWLRSHGASGPPDRSAEFIDRGLALLNSTDDQPAVLAAARQLDAQALLLSLEELPATDRAAFGAYLYDLSAALRVSGLLKDTAAHQYAATLQTISPILGHPGQTSRQPAKRSLKTFQGGMTFAHEGYQVVNGYGGSTVDASLDSLAKLAVNSLAIVPYTFQRDPNVVGELPVSESAGGENNGSIRSCIRRAKARGWTVLLKPQIWVGRNSWPGDIDLNSPAEWEDWFRRYTQWILNYALMAEAEGVEALCIGTELRHTTMKEPRRWRKLIESVRAVYFGQLTYAANWGEEFEQLAFADALDIIGLNSYYPLSAEADPADEVLLAAARDWVRMANEVAKKNNKQWWLTEVGYRSVERSWLNPHADAGDRGVSFADQARCYQALLTALGEADRLTGCYVWKWPSFLGRGQQRRNGDIGFTPGGKPAAQLLADFYAQKTK